MKPPLNQLSQKSQNKTAAPTKEPPADDGGRRDFFRKSLAVAAGSLAFLAPVLAGIMVLLDPLRRKGTAGAAIKVTTLASLPDDGVPRKFPVLSDKVDAWNKYHNVPVGAVYLRRASDGTVTALNVVCPHAGCFVDFAPGRGGYLCPCHNSTFALDGKITDPKSPSPRPMDSLPVEVRANGEIWVTFQNFQAGLPDKVPVA